MTTKQKLRNTILGLCKRGLRKPTKLVQILKVRFPDEAMIESEIREMVLEGSIILTADRKLKCNK